MSGYWEAPDDYAPEPQITNGSAHSVSNENKSSDCVEDLRKTVEEITRKPVQRENRQIGFIR